MEQIINKEKIIKKENIQNLDINLSTSPNYYRENIRINDNKNIFCGNCGKLGHTYRKCRLPITSCGVILFKINKKFKPIIDLNNKCINLSEKYFFLLIKRKDTLGYVEFLRGKYDENNKEYLIKIFNTMTKTEIIRIKNLEFKLLWNELWCFKNNNLYQQEYDNSLIKFNNLKNKKYFNLDNIIEMAATPYIDKEWGFPKGRRNIKETDYNCAVREFEEETGFQKKEYNILKNIKPVEEIFYGSNNIKYKHIYYIGQELENKKLEIDPNNKYQATEIGGISWFNFNDSLNQIRPYNIEKKKVLKKVFKLLLNNNC